MSLLSENVIPGNHGKVFGTNAKEPRTLEKIKSALELIDGIKDVILHLDVYPKKLTIHTSKVKAKVTGSGDMTLSGSTDELQIHVTGSGDFDGESLTSNRTDVSCTGSGDAMVVANTNLNAKVHGSGDIEYKGKPIQKDIRIFGSGDVNQYTEDI